MFNKQLITNILAFTAVSTALFAVDPVLEDGLYRLNNHPDGNKAAPFYGLRIDELVDVTAGKDVITFDFDDARSSMFMDLDGSNLRIYGQVFGGLDIGSSYDPNFSGLWDVDFLYTNVNQIMGASTLEALDSDNSGSISQLFGDMQTYELFDFGGMKDFSFRLGENHRGFDGVSGWGWLATADGHVKSQDWLFTVDPTPVPEPATYLLLGSTLLLVGYLRRRRQAA